MTTTDPLGDWFRHIGTKLSDTDYEAGIRAIAWARDQFQPEHMNPERPEHMNPDRTNADTSRISAEPSDAEVRAAAEALDGHSWMTDPDEGSLCACGEVLAPSLKYAGDAYRSHIARAALVAAREVARHE